METIHWICTGIILAEAAIILALLIVALRMDDDTPMADFTIGEREE